MTPIIGLIEKQTEELKKANNARFKLNDKGMEYRIKYEGGLTENFAVYGRPFGTEKYNRIVDFPAFRLYTKEQVITMAKEMVRYTKGEYHG